MEVNRINAVFVKKFLKELLLSKRQDRHADEKADKEDAWHGGDRAGQVYKRQRQKTRRGRVHGSLNIKKIIEF